MTPLPIAAQKKRMQKRQKQVFSPLAAFGCQLKTTDKVSQSQKMTV